MKVQLLQVPYDSGHRGIRMGGGPEHLVEHGAIAALTSDGHDVSVESIESERVFRTEATSAVELCRKLAARTRHARSRRAFPVILSGNCNASLGALAALGPQPLGLVWFDAHGDFNTPETTDSGYFDGMGMAIAAGRCWNRLAATIPEFRPLAEDRILHVGGRDFDPAETALLMQSSVQVIPASRIRDRGLEEALEPGLRELRQRVDRVYVHVDLDVLDATEAPANEYAIRLPGGLAVRELEVALAMIRERFELAGAGLAAYDPGVDPEGRAVEAGIRILRSLTRNEGSEPST